MPSKPGTEPTLEELSSYIDNELDPNDQARVAEHVAGCVGCQDRLAGLRQTAYAIRGLPMETPPRSFTGVVPQQRRAWRWAPVGWVGSAAVAVLLIGIGLTHLPAGGAPTAGNTAMNAPDKHISAGAGAAGRSDAFAPVAGPASSALDQQSQSAALAASGNVSRVVDPNNSSRSMIVSTDSGAYPAQGKMRLTIQLIGSPTGSTNSNDQGLTVTLVRNGVGVALKPVGVESYNGTPIFGGWYDLSTLPLPSPAAGNYQLIATWVLPDGSGRILQAAVPLQLTGN